ncbi:SRPBCC family protein [Kitasatospora sp. NPDC059408]|uniref:SRPBCC family protein n=1 Tax=Kitasatospora sp. NPDC059408 TaxID=3346823 RepID=UPI0036BE1301
MVRLVDGPTVELDVYVAAPCARVWALVSDITVPTRFGGELYEAEWLDGATGPAVGATFVGRNRNELLGQWETVSRIADHRPERAIGWDVRGFKGGFDRPVARWRLDLEPEGDGTRLRHSVTLGAGSSYLSRAIAAEPGREEEIMALRLGMLRQGMRTTLDGIRRLAEA